MLDGEIERPRQRVSNERKVFAGWRVRFPEYLEMIWIIHKRPRWSEEQLHDMENLRMVCKVSTRSRYWDDLQRVRMI